MLPATMASVVRCNTRFLCESAQVLSMTVDMESATGLRDVAEARLRQQEASAAAQIATLTKEVRAGTHEDGLRAHAMAGVTRPTLWLVTQP